ncbi:unnamed protein product [Didymodactylos carnosus]|uniref:Uncharacterized protein n=1 Tax=Didymodactylos carnosus TaxID=1234261 RepID=A0A813UQK9_9BILA|nr:unnamed protein product [Didymodactylos carnosus]CAF0830853.1 unnamed protein product [Didymodactylos carnosus]CAF3600550.1 unnamed protein product [Didymodactylos carnosus]CAF3617915.1 unnamed protein product [Didymodactylos carnosus]
MPLTSGTIYVKNDSKICYVPQEPWIFSGTIRENILFGLPHDSRKFTNCIYTAALNKDLENLPYGEGTLVGDQGVILSGGQKARLSLARALYRDDDIYLLDDPLSAVDVEVGRHLFEKCILGKLRSKICVLVTHQIQFLKYATKILFMDKLTTPGEEEEETIMPLLAEKPTETQTVEIKQTGKIHKKIFLEYFRAGLGIFGMIILFLMFKSSASIFILANWWLGRWSNQERIRYETFDQISTMNCTIPMDNRIKNMSTEEWLKERNRNFYVLLVAFLINCLIAARTLHNRMFQAILRCPVLFFDTNPIGRVINRFSKDVSSLDEQLTAILYDITDVSSTIMCTIIFIAIVQPISLIAMAIISIVLYYVRNVFSPAMRDVKRLESLARSPIYSHLSATLHGVPLIRSYRSQSLCLNDFSYHLDSHTKVYSIMVGITRWAGMRIDCIASSFVGLLTTSVFAFHRNLPISDLSLILAYSFGLIGSVQWFTRLSVDVAMHMTSVERVLEYCNLKPEEISSKTLKSPPPQWPSAGSIIFDNVSFRYSPENPWVLNSLNITILPGEKSSIIQALFRMAELEGNILIDGIDTKQISLHNLRRHISIIPQNPVLFNDTLRINLDPFGEYSDIEIWKALDEVQLKSELVNGLSQQVTEGGTNFSVGQRQLICLARALLRKNKILVIDEATANVDHRTDQLIQISIRKKFVDNTVLTIAHRLRTIIDSDKILTLSDGQAVEFANGYELLLDETSYFYNLVHQAGEIEAAFLLQQAKSYFRQKKGKYSEKNIIQ